MVYPSVNISQFLGNSALLPFYLIHVSGFRVCKPYAHHHTMWLLADLDVDILGSFDRCESMWDVLIGSIIDGSKIQAHEAGSQVLKCIFERQRTSDGFSEGRL